MITEKHITSLVVIMRRAPLNNMDEAEAVSKLLDEVIQVLRQHVAPHTLRVIDNPGGDKAENGSTG